VILTQSAKVRPTPDPLADIKARRAAGAYHEEVTHDGRNWSPRAERSCACERMGDANHRLLEALKKRARS